MKTMFFAAVYVAICAGPATVLAEDARPSRPDDLIRRELKVGDPADPNQIAKGRSIKKCGQSAECVPPDTVPTVRPRVRSLLQNSPSY